MEFARITSDKKTAARVAWLVYLFCAGLMGVLSYLWGWTVWITVGLAVNVAGLAFLTFHPKGSVRLQSVFLMLCTFLNIFVCSVMERNLYPALSVFLGATILLVIYRNERLLLSFSGLTAVAILAHVLLLKTVSFGTPREIAEFITRVAILFMAQFFLVVILRGSNVNREEMLKSVEEARQAERYKSDFLANMSHEIRTPMNAIIGMCELILRENSLSDSVRENCFNIQASGKSLLSIINDVLDFSKIESGKMELLNIEFNIATTLNDVINMSEARRQAKDIEILVDIDPDIPRGLIGDEVRIRQVMINLMSNAVKFTEHGSVTLTVSHVPQDYGANLVVSVADTGIGITEENIEKLFTSFRQVNTRKNRSVEGTGLGLAICKRLIRQMGGFISVKSEYGVGSEFRFVIPLKVADSRPFVSLKQPDKIYAAAWFGGDDVGAGQEKIFCETIQRLGVRFQCAPDLAALRAMLEEEGFTHLFVGSREYLADEAFFAEVARKLRVFVIQHRIDALALPAGIKPIYRPFYAIPLVSALNNESIVLNLNERRGADIHFTAPKARVLLVDDNVINLKVATGLMQPYNMQIITAQSGMEAIRILRSREIDLVFMDHMMAEMDGIEATGIIRGMEGAYYKTLPIIALSANAVNGAREMFLGAGFNDFVAKPIELSALDRVLRNYLPKEYMQAPTKLYYRRGGRRKSDRADDAASLLDFERGMSYAGGNEATYRENLALFQAKSAETMEQIGALFARSDMKNYAIEVHALKSTALSVGAVGLSELAKELETASKAGNLDAVSGQNGALLQLYGEVSGAIRRYLEETEAAVAKRAETDAAELTEISLAELRQAIGQARVACQGFNGNEVAEIAERLARHTFDGKPLREAFERAAQLARDFEYEAAEQELAQLEAAVSGEG